MEIYQLRTFVTVAREGSITRASELLFLSQPAVSAHIKAMEDELGLILFERTPRGMSLSGNGAKLLAKAEQMIVMQRDFIDEARRIKGRVSGKIRLGSNRSTSAQVLGKLLTRLSETCPEMEVALEYGRSAEIVRAIRSGTLDAGFYTDDGNPDAELETIEVDRFGVFLAVPRGWIDDVVRPDWQKLARMPWICPASNTCCGRAAESLFERNGFRPQKLVSVDQENVTRTLIAGGVGVGLLHAETAREAEAKGEVVLLGGVQQEVRVLFANLCGRAHDPLIGAVSAAVREILGS
ncbi:MAG: LysR family transcriptional regulator [Nitrospirota bacterium]|nr:LysR family transcriptional regulator [Nitrospirota bacterium]